LLFLFLFLVLNFITGARGAYWMAQSIDDIIIAPDKAISYAIVNAGGFLGLAKHDVAVPVSKFKLVDGKLVLPGATKEALKASPEFEYANSTCLRLVRKPQELGTFR
jgi:hypothetical protein